MILFILLVTLVPFLSGTWFFAFKKNKTDFSFGETYLMGLLFLLTLGEAAACVVIKLKAPFSLFFQIVGYGALFACLLSLVMNMRVFKEAMKRGRAVAKRTEEALTDKKQRMILAISIILLCLLQVAAYFVYVPDTTGDTMAETIWSTVLSGQVFTENPVTGLPFEAGIFPLYKLASLPLLYAMLFKLCGISMELFLFYLIPIWVICVHFVMMYRWGTELFSLQIGKRQWFLLFYGILLAVGDGTKEAFPYILLHRGWTGTAMAFGVAIPFIGYMIYRLLTEKEWVYGGLGLLMGVTGFLFSRPLFLPKSSAFFAESGNCMWSVLLVGAMALYLTWDRSRMNLKRREIICVIAFLVTGIYMEIPMTILGAAYICALVYSTIMGRGQEKRIIVGLIIICCLSGTVLPFSSSAAKRVYASEENTRLLEEIDELAAKYTTPYLLAPDTVMEKVREHNGNIRLPYGKDLWQEDCNREVADIYTEEQAGLWAQMQTDYLQPNLIAAMATDIPCNILVLRECLDDETMIRYDWQEAVRLDSYAVYTRQIDEFVIK